jgi:hypothetical protein
VEIELIGITKSIDSNKKEMARLRNEFISVSSTKFIDAYDKVLCPKCGYNVYEKSNEQEKEAWNLRKSEKLTEINIEGKALKSKNEALNREKGSIEKNQKALKDVVNQLDLDINNKTKEKEIAVGNAGKDKMEIIEDLEKKIKIVKEAIVDTPLDTSELETKVKEERAKLAQIDGSLKTRARIEELAQEEKDLAAKYEELERQTNLIERFIVKKVDLLEDTINERFGMVRFKLFEVQINEGINECCVTLVPDKDTGALVTWDNVNTGGKINGGLDIIKTLQEYYGVKAPCWIDHAESVTDILDIGSQTIYLKVDESYKDLEVRNITSQTN